MGSIRSPVGTVGADSELCLDPDLTEETQQLITNLTGLYFGVITPICYTIR